MMLIEVANKWINPYTVVTIESGTDPGTSFVRLTNGHGLTVDEEPRKVVKVLDVGVRPILGIDGLDALRA